MKVQFQLLAQLRVAAGQAEAQVDCEPGATLNQAVRLWVCGAGPEAEALLLDNQGSLRSTVLASIDGKQVRGPRRLRDGEIVILGTPISGG